MFGRKMSDRKEKKTETKKMEWVCPVGADKMTWGPGGCKYMDGINANSIIGACRDEINAEDSKTEDKARVVQLKAVISFLKTFRYIEKKAEKGYYSGFTERIRGTPLERAIERLEEFKEQIVSGERNV